MMAEIAVARDLGVEDERDVRSPSVSMTWSLLRWRPSRAAATQMGFATQN